MTTNAKVQPADIGFFSALAAAGSLSAAARELGITTPAVSKRLAQMETRLGIALVNRSTRRMSLTAEGQLYLDHARRILPAGLRRGFRQRSAGGADRPGRGGAG